MNYKTVLAVVLAGLVGSLAYALAAAVLVDAAQLRLTLNPGFYLVGVFFALPLPVVYRFLPGAWSAVLALLLLTVLPAVVSKTEGGAMLSWHVLLALTFIYALTALVVYRLVLGPR